MDKLLADIESCAYQYSADNGVIEVRIDKEKAKSIIIEYMDRFSTGKEH